MAIYDHGSLKRIAKQNTLMYLKKKKVNSHVTKHRCNCSMCFTDANKVVEQQPWFIPSIVFVFNALS